MPTIAVFYHVPYERLGTFEPVFAKSRFTLQAVDVFRPQAAWPSVDAIDGLVVMGGPMGVYEQDKYPFLAKEISFIQALLRQEKAILGVCLGAQLLAAALGARVVPNPQKEIGWYSLMREAAADNDPLMQAFGQTETVFQWHGDTWTLPKGAVRLAGSPLCMEQAFRFGKNAYGLQFHVEVNAAMVRAWMATPSGKAELATLKGIIDPAAIRSQSAEHLGRLQELSEHVAGAFCEVVQERITTGVKTDAAKRRSSASKR